MAATAISYCIDAEARITSLCPNDMSGNSDWYLSTVQALGLDMDSELYDDHGACLYRLENGAAVLRTEEERRADWPEEPEEPPTMEERMDAVEADNLVALEGIAEIYEMLLQ